MPTRPSSHQLEDESRRAFGALLGIWVFRSKTPDYGIDGEVEIFDENGKATGDQLLVQLKSVEHAPKSRSISLKIEWINYYYSLELPVLIALWAKDLNTTFWTWASEIDLFYAKRNAKYFAVRLPYVWDSNTPAQIQRHLQLRRRLISRQPPEPLKVTVGTPGRSALRVHLQALCAHAQPVLVYSEDSADVTCTLSKDELRISFGGFRGSVLHLSRELDDASMAAGTIMGIVISLANFGAVNQAAELWASVPNLHKTVTTLDVAWRIVSMLAKAGAYAELRALITALKPRFGKVALIVPLQALHFSSPKHRRNQLTDLLAEFEQQDLKDASPEDKSTASYNLARLCEDTNARKAVHHFAEAIRASSFYFDKAYFWGELGAFLFSHRRYHASLRCYEHAYLKLGKKDRQSHYGDALMHTGQYSEALQVFQCIVEEGKARAGQADVAHDEMFALDIADAAIKVKALELIAQGRGIRSQKRQSHAAAQFLGDDIQGLSNVDVLVRTEAAIGADALSNHAWFNRGLALQRLGRNEEALESFLAAAAVRTGDDEAWLKVLFLAQNLNRDLLASLQSYLPRHRGADFVRYLTKAAQQRSDEAGRQVLSRLAKLFEENTPSPRDAVIRIHGKKGKMTVLKARTR